MCLTRLTSSSVETHLLPHTRTCKLSDHNIMRFREQDVRSRLFTLISCGKGWRVRLRSAALYFLPAKLFCTEPEKVATTPYAYVSRTENLSSRAVSGWTAAHSSPTQRSPCFCGQGKMPGRGSDQPGSKVFQDSQLQVNIRMFDTLESPANFVISFFFKLSTHLEAIRSCYLN